MICKNAEIVDDGNSYIIYASFIMQIGICGSMDAYQCSFMTKENEPLNMLLNNAHAFAFINSTVGSVTAILILLCVYQKRSQYNEMSCKL